MCKEEPWIQVCPPSPTTTCDLHRYCKSTQVFFVPHHQGWCVWLHIHHYKEVVEGVWPSALAAVLETVV